MVQGTPKYKGVEGNWQSIKEHDGPNPGHGPQLSEGKEQQIELQDQPGNCEVGKWKKTKTFK